MISLTSPSIPRLVLQSSLEGTGHGGPGGRDGLIEVGRRAVTWVNRRGLGGGALDQGSYAVDQWTKGARQLIIGPKALGGGSMDPGGQAIDHWTKGARRWIIGPRAPGGGSLDPGC